MSLLPSEAAVWEENSSECPCQLVRAVFANSSSSVVESKGFMAALQLQMTAELDASLQSHRTELCTVLLSDTQKKPFESTGEPAFVVALFVIALSACRLPVP